MKELQKININKTAGNEISLNCAERQFMIDVNSRSIRELSSEATNDRTANSVLRKKKPMRTSVCKNVAVAQKFILNANNYRTSHVTVDLSRVNLLAINEFRRDISYLNNNVSRQFYSESKFISVLHEFCVREKLAKVGFSLNIKPDSIISLENLDCDQLNLCERTHGERSPGCIACGKDLGCTIRITDKCNRQCFFCFNGERMGFQMPSLSEIDAYIVNCMSIKKVRAFAVSGGEPLLYPRLVIDAFRIARQRIGAECHYRLYTNGDYLTDKLISELARNGVDELRLSIKPENDIRDEFIRNLCVTFPSVWIEIPAIPGNLRELKQLIDKLDAIGVKGLNLIEMYFAGFNSRAFRQNGLKLRVIPIRPSHFSMPPFEYPVSGSREEAIQAVAYARKKKTRLSVHACLHETRREMFIEQNRRISKANLTEWQKIDSDGLPRTVAVFRLDRNYAKQRGLKRISPELQFNSTRYFLCHPDEAFLITNNDREMFEIVRSPDCKYVSNIRVQESGRKYIHIKIKSFQDLIVNGNNCIAEQLIRRIGEIYSERQMGRIALENE